MGTVFLSYILNLLVYSLNCPYTFYFDESDFYSSYVCFFFIAARIVVIRCLIFLNLHTFLLTMFHRKSMLTRDQYLTIILLMGPLIKHLLDEEHITLVINVYNFGSANRTKPTQLWTSFHSDLFLRKKTIVYFINFIFTLNHFSKFLIWVFYFLICLL